MMTEFSLIWTDLLKTLKSNDLEIGNRPDAIWGKDFLKKDSTLLATVSRNMKIWAGRKIIQFFD